MIEEILVTEACQCAVCVERSEARRKIAELQKRLDVGCVLNKLDRALLDEAKKKFAATPCSRCVHFVLVDEDDGPVSKGAWLCCHPTGCDYRKEP